MTGCEKGDSPRREAQGHKSVMHGHGKSDSSIVPEKLSNKAEGKAAEMMEGRELAKGNSLESNTSRTQCRTCVPSGIERVRQVARKEKRQKFTALLHHVYDKTYLEKTYKEEASALCWRISIFITSSTSGRIRGGGSRLTETSSS